MAEEVLQDVFRIELPLPRNPLKAINSYMIIGEKRNLVIDTGMNRPECLAVMEKELEDIGLDLSKTDVFVTHLHADHLGLAPFVSKGKTSVFMGEKDIDMISESDFWKKMYSFGVRNGFPKMDPQTAINKHPGYKYGPLGDMNLVGVKDGDLINVGQYELRAVHTPGHTHGHMCLIDIKKKVLFSGDHILKDITPNISLWEDGVDCLSDYINSLKMVREMNIEITLPGHRSIITDHRKRIDELIHHHNERADEVVNILSTGPKNAFKTASEMTWDLTIKDFKDFPIMQKWFAMGEALAHLRFLETREKVKRDLEGEIIEYRLC